MAKDNRDAANQQRRLLAEREAARKAAIAAEVARQSEGRDLSGRAGSRERAALLRDAERANPVERGLPSPPGGRYGRNAPRVLPDPQAGPQAGPPVEPGVAPPPPRMGPPTLMDDAVEQAASVNTNVPRPKPPAPPQTITTAAGNTFPAQGGGKGEFNPQEDTVPEGYVEVIRGTSRSYQGLNDRGGTAGRAEFRARPGMSLPESERVAGAADPGFQFLDEQDVERQRVNAANVNAEANMIQARFGNMQTGVDINGIPRMWIASPDGGFQTVEGAFPVLAAASADVGRFEFSQGVDPETGMPVDRTLDTASGTVRNVTQEEAMSRAIMDVSARMRQMQDNGEPVSPEVAMEIIEDMDITDQLKNQLMLLYSGGE